MAEYQRGWLHKIRPHSREPGVSVRRMSREVKQVLVAAGMVAVLFIAMLALLLNPVATEESGIVIKDKEPGDVARVLVQNSHGTLNVAFSDPGYLVDDIPAELVAPEPFIRLLLNCGEVKALRSVASGSRDLAAYGLAKPGARVEIDYTDGSTLTLHIGDVERVTGNYYFRVQGDPALYLMEVERGAGFLLPKKAYVDHLVTPRLALSSPLSALLDVTFAGGSLIEPVTVEAVATRDPEVLRAAISFGAPTHIVRGRGVYQLDQTYAVAKLGSLLGILAQDIVGYNLTQDEIAAFGFDRPAMQVTFDLKNGVDAPIEHYRLSLLHKDDAFFMIANDNGVVYAVQEPAFYAIEYEKLPVRWFLSPLLMDVRSIELRVQDEDYTFVITGESRDEKRVTINGEELDMARFRAFYRLLISAAHDGRLLEDVALQGAPILRLTYHYLDEQKLPDTMELYPGESRRLYVKVNDVAELVIRETYLSRVEEALLALRSGAPIETDW